MQRLSELVEQRDRLSAEITAILRPEGGEVTHGGPHRELVSTDPEHPISESSWIAYQLTKKGEIENEEVF